MLSSYIILIISFVINSNCSEDILSEYSCSSDSMQECIKNHSAESANDKLGCFEKLYLNELKLAELNETKTSQGIIAYWHTSPGNNLHYKHEYNGYKFELNQNIKTNDQNSTPSLSELQQRYQKLGTEVKIIKSLLEKAIKNLKTVKKQLKNENKLVEIPKMKDDQDQGKNETLSQDKSTEEHQQKGKEKSKKKQKKL